MVIGRKRVKRWVVVSAEERRGGGAFSDIWRYVLVYRRSCHTGLQAKRFTVKLFLSGTILSDVNCPCPFLCASFLAAPASRGYTPHQKDQGLFKPKAMNEVDAGRDQAGQKCRINPSKLQATSTMLPIRTPRPSLLGQASEKKC